MLYADPMQPGTGIGAVSPRAGARSASHRPEPASLSSRGSRSSASASTPALRAIPRRLRRSTASSPAHTGSTGMTAMSWLKRSPTTAATGSSGIPPDPMRPGGERPWRTASRCKAAAEGEKARSNGRPRRTKGAGVGVRPKLPSGVRMNVPSYVVGSRTAEILVEIVRLAGDTRTMSRSASPGDGMRLKRSMGGRGA
jgi:hypothetical protein